MIDRTVTVELGMRSYPIRIRPGLLNDAREVALAMGTPTSVCLVSHPRLAALYCGPLLAALKEMGLGSSLTLVPPGERHKRLSTVERLYSVFVEAGLDRRGVVVALGGGVLGDLVGFAAATYLRGVQFIQIPTTLLAQVDASVGGKTGVDLPSGKNLVGAFHQPKAVLIDPNTLRSLPLREIRSGLAEILKYGIICDEAFFERITSQIKPLLRREPAPLVEAIARSCALKADVVGADETEQGRREILNFGHTIGHALEAVTHYRRYKHGEAISIGMVCAALIGVEMGVSDPVVPSRIVRSLALAGLPTQFPADVSAEAIVEACYRDKKSLAGALRFVLVERIGSVLPSVEVPAKTVLSVLASHRQLSVQLLKQ